MNVLGDIVVVPKYDSNQRLKGEVEAVLSQHLDVRTSYGQPPKIIIFRPTGRPADEFREAVSPILENSSSAYLVVAFSGQYKNITELVPYELRDRVRRTVVIYIQSGSLVSRDSPYYDNNQRELENFARQLASNFDGVSQGTEPSSSVDFENILSQQSEYRLLGRAVLLLKNFPEGMHLNDMVQMMKPDNIDALDLVLKTATSVFTRGEQEENPTFKLDDTFLTDLRQRQIITVADVARFLDNVKRNPDVVEGNLVRRIEQQLSVQEGEILNRLGNMLKTYTEDLQSAPFNSSDFKRMMESGSIDVDEQLKALLEREFGRPFSEVMSALRTMCQKLGTEFEDHAPQ